MLHKIPPFLFFHVEGVFNKDNNLYSVTLNDNEEELKLSYDLNYKKATVNVIKEKNKAISTKGIFEKCYEYQNQRYHNIIDSSTLFPANYMKSVTVITENIKEADMLSTMLFLMSVEDGMQYIETLENTEAIWYQNDNTITYSSGLKDIFTKNT